MDSKFKIKKLLKLELQILFYSITLGIISMCFVQKSWDAKIIINSIMPVTRGLYWFPTIYVGMYLLSPFLNKLIKTMTRENYKALLVMLFVTMSIIPTVMFNNKIMMFIYIYLIAAYIRTYDVKILEKKNYLNIIIAIGIYIYLYF